MPAVVSFLLHPLFERLQRDEETPEFGALVKVAPSKPAKRHGVGDAGPLSRISCACAPRDRCAPGSRRGQGDRSDEIAAIERRHEARRRASELKVSKADQSDIDHQHHCDQATDAPGQSAVEPATSDRRHD
jgi:hypothetical protein